MPRTTIHFGDSITTYKHDLKHSLEKLDWNVINDPFVVIDPDYKLYISINNIQTD